MGVGGGFQRAPKDFNNVSPTVDRDLESVFRFLKQTSITISQVINTDTGSILKPIEVINPDVVKTSKTPGTAADDPINPSDPDAAAPQPTGVPSAMELSGEEKALVIAGAVDNVCFISITKPMKVTSATVSWFNGADDFTGTASVLYQLSLLSDKLRGAFDQGSMRTFKYPVYGAGSQTFPGQFKNDGVLNAGDRVYIRVTPIGSPANITTRDWRLTLIGTEYFPQQ